MVLTDYAWKTFFNSDPDIVGKQISLSWRLYTVLGIMPPGFRFPVEGERADYFIPLHPLVPEHVNNRDSHFIRMVGRLKPGVTIQHCDAEMKTIAARLEQQYPKSNTGRSERVFSLHNDVVRRRSARPHHDFRGCCFCFVDRLRKRRQSFARTCHCPAARDRDSDSTWGESRPNRSQLLGEGFLLSSLGACGGLLLAWWGIDFCVFSVRKMFRDSRQSPLTAPFSSSLL